MKALWQTAGPFIMILDRMKTSDKVLEQLTDSVSHFLSGETCAPKNITEMQALNSAYKFLSLSSTMEIMSYDIFLQKKLLHGESIAKQQAGSKDKATVVASNENPKSLASLSDVKNMLSTACDGSLLGKLTRLLASCQFDNETYYRAKVVFIQFIFSFFHLSAFKKKHCNLYPSVLLSFDFCFLFLFFIIIIIIFFFFYFCTLELP